MALLLFALAHAKAEQYEKQFPHQPLPPNNVGVFIITLAAHGALDRGRPWPLVAARGLDRRGRPLQPGRPWPSVAVVVRGRPWPSADMVLRKKPTD